MAHRTLAAAFTTALLSLAAFNASAGPLSGAVADKLQLYRTVTLQCAAGQYDGEGLKGNRTVLKNTSGVTIPKGTTITIAYRTLSFGRVRIVTAVAYRDIYANATIPMGDSGNARRCTASAKISLLYKNATR